MDKIEKKLRFFLDIINIWCNKRKTGSISLVLHFQKGLFRSATVTTSESVPDDV